MRHRSTHCRGYYQHECGVELTERNRSTRRSGLCIECGKRYQAAAYYRRVGKNVPPRVHDGHILTKRRRTPAAESLLADRDCAGNLAFNDKQDRQAKAAVAAMAPWRNGPFTLLDLPGGVVLRFGDGRDLTNQVINELAEALDLTEMALYDLAAWLLAACRRKGMDPASGKKPRRMRHRHQGRHDGSNQHQDTLSRE